MKRILLLMTVFIFALRLHCQDKVYRVQGEVPELYKTGIYDKYELINKNPQFSKNFSARLAMNLHTYMKKNFVVFGDSLQFELQNMVHNILTVNRIDRNIEVYISNDIEQNAISMAPNYIFVNSGLLVTIQNQKQLYFVLCHEIAHILLNHSRNIDFIISKNYNDMKKMESEVLMKLINSISQYSVNQEFEADLKGWEYMSKLGFPKSEIHEVLIGLDNNTFLKKYFPDSALLPFYYQNQVIQICNQDKSPKLIFRTHPDISTRIDRVKMFRLSKELISSKDYLMDDKKFQIFRKTAIENSIILSKIYGNCLAGLKSQMVYDKQFGFNQSVSEVTVLNTLSYLFKYSRQVVYNNYVDKYHKPSPIDINSDKPFFRENPGIDLIALQLSLDSLALSLLKFTIAEIAKFDNSKIKYKAILQNIHNVASNENFKFELVSIWNKTMNNNLLDSQIKSEMNLRRDYTKNDGLPIRYGNMNRISKSVNYVEIPRNSKLFVDYKFFNLKEMEFSKKDLKIYSYCKKETERLYYMTGYKLEEDSKVGQNTNVANINRYSLYNLQFAELENLPYKEFPQITASWSFDSFFSYDYYFDVSMIAYTFIKSNNFGDFNRTGYLMYIRVLDNTANRPVYIYSRRIVGKPRKAVLSNIMHAILKNKKKWKY